MKKWQIVALSMILCVMMVVSVACTKPAPTPTTPTTPETPTTPTTPAAEPIVLKLAHVVAEDTSLHKGAVAFADSVKAATNGLITVDVYPNAQLGNNDATLEAQQFGTIDLNIPNGSLIGPYSTKYAVFGLPYLLKGIDYAKAVVEDPYVVKECYDPLVQSGFKLLGTFCQGWRHLTTTKVPVQTPADIKGLKIRTMSTEIHMDHFKAIGANPVPLAFSELFTALQQGAVDGQENPFVNIYTQGMHEVQGYITETGHIYDVCPLLMSTISYDKLSADDQALMNAEGIKAGDTQRALAQEEEVTYKQKILDSGAKIQIISLTEAERQAFRDAAQPVYDKWAASVTTELIDKIASLQK